MCPRSSSLLICALVPRLHSFLWRNLPAGCFLPVKWGSFLFWWEPPSVLRLFGKPRSGPFPEKNAAFFLRAMFGVWTPQSLGSAPISKEFALPRSGLCVPWFGFLRWETSTIVLSSPRPPCVAGRGLFVDQYCARLPYVGTHSKCVFSNLVFRLHQEPIPTVSSRKPGTNFVP